MPLTGIAPSGSRKHHQDESTEQPQRAEPACVDQAQDLAPHAADARSLSAAILRTSVWLALVTGGIEAIYWLVRQHMMGELLFMHPGYFWMAPLAQLPLFLIPGISLAFIARRTGQPELLPFSATLLSCIAWLNCVELFVPGLNLWSWILLTLGLATVTGRFFQKRAELCNAAIRRSVVWFGLLFVALGVGQTAWNWSRESQAVAAISAQANPAAPNVLLIVLDTVRADALQLYSAENEGEIPTGFDPILAPNLAKLANTGVTFDNAYATSSWTLPSHGSMFTGHMPGEFSADWLSKLDDTYPTMAEELSQRGWLTGGFVANTYYCNKATGLSRGFSHYEGYMVNWAEIVTCSALGRKVLFSNIPTWFGQYDRPARKQAPDINQAFLAWLDKHSEAPYFAYLNYFDAHDPYFAPRQPAQHASDKVDDLLMLRYWWSTHKDELTDEQIAVLEAAYRDCLVGLDAYVGELFLQLETRGQLDNTLIVVTADHGEHFGDHGLFLHGNSLYEPLIHVPLIVSWPGHVPAGQRVQTPVSLQGFSNTVFELLDVQAEFPGEAWTRHWDGRATAGRETEPVFSEIIEPPHSPPCHGHSPVFAGTMRCVRLGDLKYICCADQSEQLYDLATDPQELKNLVDVAAFVTKLQELRKLCAPPNGR